MRIKFFSLLFVLSGLPPMVAVSQDSPYHLLGVIKGSKAHLLTSLSIVGQQPLVYGVSSGDLNSVALKALDDFLNFEFQEDHFLIKDERSYFELLRDLYALTSDFESTTAQIYKNTSDLAELRSKILRYQRDSKVKALHVLGGFLEKLRLEVPHAEYNSSMALEVVEILQAIIESNFNYSFSEFRVYKDSVGSLWANTVVKFLHYVESHLAQEERAIFLSEIISSTEERALLIPLIDLILKRPNTDLIRPPKDDGFRPQEFSDTDSNSVDIDELDERGFGVIEFEPESDPRRYRFFYFLTLERFNVPEILNHLGFVSEEKILLKMVSPLELKAYRFFLQSLANEALIEYLLVERSLEPETLIKTIRRIYTSWLVPENVEEQVIKFLKPRMHSDTDTRNLGDLLMLASNEVLDVRASAIETLTELDALLSALLSLPKEVSTDEALSNKRLVLADRIIEVIIDPLMNHEQILNPNVRDFYEKLLYDFLVMFEDIQSLYPKSLNRLTGLFQYYHRLESLKFWIEKVASEIIFSSYKHPLRNVEVSFAAIDLIEDLKENLDPEFFMKVRKDLARDFPQRNASIPLEDQVSKYDRLLRWPSFNEGSKEGALQVEQISPYIIESLLGDLRVAPMGLRSRCSRYYK